MPTVSLTRRARTLAARNPFLTVVLVLAAASCIVVPPSWEYRHYFEPRTLMSLFCFLAVVCALSNAHVITALAELAVRTLRSRRALIGGLVVLTLVASMLITNDMALIAFLPLAYLALLKTGNTKHLAFTFVMMAVAANLGGMIMPFGSPQNLFLYQHFHIPFGEFMALMALPFAISVVAVIAICLTVKPEPVTPFGSVEKIDVRRAVVAAILFGVVIAMVLRALPVWSGVVVAVVLLVVDAAALRDVDYGLLLTFAGFFLLTGNIAQIDAVDTALTGLLDGKVLVVSALTSQVISNVPTAFLFAPFTDDYRELLVGVNVGGVGTIVASLASLIALRYYEKFQPADRGTFLKLFTVVNVGLLVVLLASAQAAFSLGVL